MTNNRQQLLSKLRRSLKDKDSSEKFWSAMTKARANRAALLEKEHLDMHAIKESNKALKTSAVANRRLVEEFAENVRKNGGQVFLAKTGKDAIGYVEELAKRLNAKLIVKAKSLTSDEIEFTHELEKAGIRSVETDLGELVIQIAGETPVHLVMPAAHKSVGEIAKLVSSAVGKDLLPEDQAILTAVRGYLRQLFLTADIGMSGANIGIAETGTIIIETNEGNGRLVTSLPKVHLVIIGMEKIVPKWTDATYLVKGHSSSATGQNMTVYVSAITKHGPLAGSMDGREYHVIILDNGRSEMRDDPWFSDALELHQVRCMHERLPNVWGGWRPHVRIHLSRAHRHSLDSRGPRLGQGHLRSPLHLVRPLQGDLPRRHQHPHDDRQGEGRGGAREWAAHRQRLFHGL